MVEVDKYKFSLKLIILVISIGLLVLLQSRDPFASAMQGPPPTITAATQPGAPISISSIILNASDPLDPEFTYLVTNGTQKSIDAYAIRYIVSFGGSSAEALELRIGDSAETALSSGQVEWGTYTGQGSQQAARSIKLVVDFVGFSDGTNWGRDEHKSGELLNGRRAGIRAETSRLVEIKAKDGLEAVLNAITRAQDDVSAPSGHTPKWEEGFRGGVSTVYARLKRAQQQGTAKVEEELQRNLGSTERRVN